MNLHIQDETSKLKKVVLGIGDSFGGTPKLEDSYDPKSREHIINGTFPKEEAILEEMDDFARVLIKHGVEVFRPTVIKDYNQVFARDISFVIEDKFIKTNMLEDRAKEVEAISHVIKRIKPENILIPPADAKIEGGDVMPWKDYIFVGYSKEEDFNKYTVARTNEAGLEFLKKSFPNKKVLGFELKKSDTEARENALHLDCCFQPVNTGKAIIYKGGFKNEEDYELLKKYFGEENIFDITKDEMYNMFSNVFSISPQVVVSEKSFKRLNDHMRKHWNMTVEEVKYSEISKMEGLLRCSTMPLERESNY